jgi:hypothetical protein
MAFPSIHGMNARVPVQLALKVPAMKEQDQM